MASLWDEVARAAACRRERVLVQPLSIGLETLSARLREPGPEGAAFVAWLKAVGEEAAEQARTLGLTVLPPIATDGGQFEDSVRRVCGRVRGAEVAAVGRR